MKPKKNVAYHEAGHTVADLYYDHIFEYVTIKPDEIRGYAGVVEGKVKDDAYHLAVVRYAGSIAEAKITKVNRLFCGCENDDKSAEIFLDIVHTTHTGGLLVGTDVIKTWHPCRKRFTFDAMNDARRIVKNNWGTIEKIAQALLEHETLSYDQVVKLS